MLSSSSYNAPLLLPGGFFHGKIVPSYSDFLRDYHIHYLRYLYYLCIMNADQTKPYPENLEYEEIERAFSEQGKKSSPACTKRIKKILIGEAPPPHSVNYFYNPASPWTSGGPGKGGTAFTGAILKCLFPGRTFATKTDFLRECAQNGFLLLDLFPYAITYSGSDRRTVAYKSACISAFGVGASPIPHNVSSVLDELKCCLQEEIAICFALTSFGQIILRDAASVSSIDGWFRKNGIALNPSGSLAVMAPVTPGPTHPSGYLRICHRRGMFGPCCRLMHMSGF